MELLQQEVVKHKLDVRLWPALHDKWRPFVGIGRAHKQIVAWAMNAKLDEVLIGEDDMFLFGPGAFEYFLSKKPEDYDIYLGNVFNPAIIPTGNRLDDFCGLTLYFIHSRFYGRFLALPDGKNHLDRMLGATDCVKIVCDPMVCSQRDGYSDNKNNMGAYQHYHLHHRLYGR